MTAQLDITHPAAHEVADRLETRRLLRGLLVRPGTLAGAREISEALVADGEVHP